MIQAKGKIEVDSEKQSAAVQKALFAKGYGWYRSLEKEPRHTDANFLTWGEWADEPKRILVSSCQIRFDETKLPLHAMSDFNLDEDGNELPLLKVGQKVTVSKELLADNCMPDDATIETVFTIRALGSENNEPFGDSAYYFRLFPNGRAYSGFDGQKESEMRFIGTVIPVANELPTPTFGNLKAGDPNPFVVGMEVVTNGTEAKVAQVEYGPRVRICTNKFQILKWYGFDPIGRVINAEDGHDINTIFPITTKQPAPQPLTPGSQAIDTKNRPCQILAIAEGFALCKYKEEPTQKHPIRAVELVKLRTKPDPVTVSLNFEYTATLDTNGATVGCQHISPEAMDELTAAWLKIRKS